MYRTISSRLTALFAVDGSHLNQYLHRAPTIKKSLCEDLILHDEILVPTQDFLTAAGLILILGESSFCDLLEHAKIKFIRTRGVWGYVRGTGPEGGLAVFGDPKNERPQDSPIDQSVDAALRVIQDRINDNKRLRRLIIDRSLTAESSEILGAVTRESIRDLKSSAIWKPEYDFENPDLVALPGVEQMQVRVLDSNVKFLQNEIDTLLALVLYNSEIYLAQKFESQNTSPFFPIGDLLNLKAKRLANLGTRSIDLWTLLEVNGIPDFSRVDFQDRSAFRDLLKVVSSRSAQEFRGWFHEREGLTDKEIFKEYLSLVKQVPWIQRLPAKVLRFVVTTAIGLVPIVGQIVDAFDTFVVDSLFRGRSPKFFIDDLTKITTTMVENDRTRSTAK
jgi:hypothetical protein